MPLAAGSSLSFYEILGPLGAGGMGEVYRARDTRLERDVAIKVLPENACEDEQLLRFEREAKMLAALNHPNVAQVFGLDREGATCFIAMELVPGEDLDARLARGPLRLDRALDVCRQIAAGLEAAHETGVVHRDLKPANVRCTPAGDVKVLDFGLAKSMSAVHGAHALTTQQGRVLGTPTYMAPEQARGAPVDRRVDVWAFGCVLYECLTGKRAFDGDTVSDVLAAVLEKEPDLDALPRGTPARVRELLARCWRKDPRRRLRDVGDARLELEELLAGRLEREVPSARRGWSGVRSVAPGLALALGAAGGVFGVRWLADDGEATATGGRYSIALPKGLVLDAQSGLAPPLAISPDGRAVVFAAIDADDVRRLYLRSADDAETRPLPGTENAEFPFFSPDGRQIGFTGHGSSGLHRLDLSDGTVQTIVTERPGMRGASWGADGAVVVGMFDQGLLRIPVAGGPAEQLTTTARDEYHHRWPQVLPDGDHVLFTASMRAGHAEARILSLATGESEPVGVRCTIARYLPSGALVYVRSDEILAVRFDLGSRRTAGEPTVVRRGVHVSVLGTPHFAVSDDGRTLVHEPTRPPSPGRSLVWVDREGRAEPLVADRGFEFPRLSPDGRRIALAIHLENSTHDIWTFDTERALGQVVTSGGNDLEPVWAPAGDALVFASAIDTDMYSHGLAADAKRELLLAREGQQFPLGWAPSGRLLFHEQTKERRWDLLELDPRDGSVRGLAVSELNEWSGTVSPDGRWLAYVSDETGTEEIYLRSYPDLATRERVTAGGGVEPVWSPRGDELFFRDGLGLYVVPIASDSDDPIGEPRLLFEGHWVAGFHTRPNYDVTADAQRFVMVDQGVALTTGRLDVALDLAAELERRLAEEAGRRLALGE